MRLIGVASRDLETISKILRIHVPDRVVWAFGSRVKGPAKKFSDLDLAVIGDEPLPAALLADLRHALDSSDLPFKVDLVDFAGAGVAFRAIIQKNHLVLQSPSGE